MSVPASATIDVKTASTSPMLGFDVQTDLFDAMGDEWALYVDPMTAGPFVTVIVDGYGAAEVPPLIAIFDWFSNCVAVSLIVRTAGTIACTRVDQFWLP